MIELTLAQIADVVGGDLDDPADGDRRVDSVVIDSRTARDGALFVALPGEHVDGHDYAAAAAHAGAAGHLHAEGRRTGAPGGIAVDDPADALLGLGLWVRDTVDPTVVMVTGSNGKTTTKDLIAAALATQRRTVATAGSQNNELGIPLTCCRLEADTEVLVAEIGMRGLGQIAELAVPLRPDIAVVTNVAEVHLELLGSIGAIAQAKSELVQALPPGGLAVLNADDHRVAPMADALPVEAVTYGVDAPADLRARDLRLDDRARPRFTVAVGGRAHDVCLGVPGAHNVRNALAALAVAHATGVDAEAAVAAIEKAALSPWRMQLSDTTGGVRILNDAYNANPDSTAAALRTLAAMDAGSAGRRIAVLGYMAEIGEGEQAAHRRTGAVAATLGLDGLVVVGERAAAIAEGAGAEGFDGGVGVHRVSDPDAAVSLLRTVLRAGDVVLAKASRSAGLERVAAGLLEDERPA